MRKALVMLLAAGCLRAQGTGTPEPLTAWPYFKEVQVQAGSQGLLDFLLDRDVFDKARTDQADLRLYDANGREIPYALRVLRAVSTTEAFEAREFNRGADGGVAQISYDLGAQPQQHNQVDVQTEGGNFRRAAEVQGSPDGAHWFTLSSAAILFRFTAGGRTVEQTAVSYPVSRYRYLRIRVSRDPETDHAAPEITTVRVLRTIEKKGENVTFPATLEAREPDRVDGRPGSIWRADFGGRVPVEGVQLSINETVFSRPFLLEGVDDSTQPVVLGSGELSRREGSTESAESIQFQEQFARRLKLTVTDDRNPALDISGIIGQSAAREIIFEAPQSTVVRVYYGNLNALAPRYDFAVRLQEDPTPAPSRLTLGPQQENPIYSPEPKPFSERSPWLVYVVLGLASLILAAILLNLAKAARTQAASAEPAS